MADKKKPPVKKQPRQERRDVPRAERRDIPRPTHQDVRPNAR